MIRTLLTVPGLSKSIILALVVISTASTTLFAVNAGLETPMQGLCLVLLVGFFLLNTGAALKKVTLPISISYAILVLFFVLWLCNEFLLHRTSSVALITVYAVGAFLTAVVLPQTFFERRGYFNFFIWCVIFVGAVVGATGILGSLGLNSLFGLPMFNKYGYARYASFPASSGILDYPETLGAQMALSFICALYMMVRSKPTPLLVLSTLLIAGGLITSQGRAAILGALVGIGAVVFAMRSRIPAAALVAIVVLLVLSPIYALNLISLLPGAGSYLRAETGLSGREGVWNFALFYIGEHPLRGYGFQSSNMYTAMHGDFLRRHGFPAAGASFHNTFLTRAFENGILVSGAYIGVLLTALYRAGGLVRRSQEAALTFAMLVVVISISTFRDINIGGMRQIVIYSAVFIGAALQLPVRYTRLREKTSSYSRQRIDRLPATSQYSG
ncbi:MAG: O-antigen ligase family protein [Novosphingobium sp.]